jgi:lipoprotein signal peptidase
VGLSQAIFGRYAANEKARCLFKVLAVVLFVDYSTKAIAMLTLDEDDRISILGGAVQFILVFNRTLKGTVVRAQEPPLLLGVWLVVALLSLFWMRFLHAERTVRFKFLALAALVSVGAVLAHPVGTALHPTFGERMVVPTRMLCFLTYSLLLLRAARSRTLFTLLTVVISASVGNLINYFLMPRGVVDFVHVPLLGRFFGVANVADYTMMVALVLVLTLIPIRIGVAILRRALAARLRWLDWVDAPLVLVPPSSGIAGVQSLGASGALEPIDGG